MYLGWWGRGGERERVGEEEKREVGEKEMKGERDLTARKLPSQRHSADNTKPTEKEI